MNDELQRKWDARYREARAEEAHPVEVLERYQHLLPAQGRALDLACGMGGNALLLARRGLATDAWDISAVAIDKLRALAVQRGLPLRAEVRDVCAQPPAAASYDVIVVSRFLERTLVPRLLDALHPQGLLFYQTFTNARVDDSGPPPGPYRLGDNELLQLFRALRLLVYREEGRVGDLAQGLRNEAQLVGQKRP